MNGKMNEESKRQAGDKERKGRKSIRGIKDV